MDSDYEFDDISEEDWHLLDQNVVATNVGAQGPAPTVTHGSNVPKSNSGPLSSLSGRQNISYNSSRVQQQPDQVFKRPLAVSGAGQNGRKTIKPAAQPDKDDYGLDDLPSDDAFDSPPARTILAPVRNTQRPSQHFRQTTLLGGTVESQDARPSQISSSRPFRGDSAPEIPTHHELDYEALKTWVYPLNLGPPRDYQFSIVKYGLFNNTLVALPTGLGKTFIAATVMLNYIRWTKTAKVVFVAPTKPLASQQVQACLSIAGVPRSQATLLTGETPPVLREGEWETKRMFFMTPQTLMNDLSKGYADPKSIVLLVIDEAHRSTGDYAYVKAVEFIRRFSKSFRVLALTATPGSSVEGVQDVIDNLGISHVEIRTEDSLDIRQYVHSRNIDTVTFDPSDEMLEVRDLFSKALKPLVNRLTAQNIYWGRDPMSITTYGLLKARQEWMAGAGKHVNQGVKFGTMAVFSILQSLAHSIKLLNFHGIKPFYQSLADFRSSEEEKKGQGSKLKRQLLDDEDFQKMMSLIEKWIKLETFNGHPKISYLCETLVNHFMDAGEGSSTRAIVFSEYRDSAEEIVRILNKQPLISATVFVGQADSKRSEGMKQKQQIETIEKFKKGEFNVLVATSIGEEGLDIGQVDLIVCYDASASPIRMLQRMGRTGRKRAGSIILLLMKGREEDKYKEAKDNYQSMQALICEGSRFTFRHDLSSRILPRDIKPEVDKRIVEIPIENTQNPELPEPKKTAAGLRKKPAKKKFNMPDGVETGFTSASSLLGMFAKQTAKRKEAPLPPPPPSEMDFIADVPDLSKVILTKSQTSELDRLYRALPLNAVSGVQEVSVPNLGAHPAAQRRLRPTVHLPHGRHTKRCVKLFNLMGRSQDPMDRYTKPYGESDTGAWKQIPVPDFAPDSDDQMESDKVSTGSGGNKRPLPPSWDEDEQDDEAQTGRKRRQVSAAKRTPNRGSSRRKAPTFVDSDVESNGESDEEDEDEDEDEEGVGESTSSPPRGGRRKPGSRGKKRGGRAGNGRKRRGDDIEDVGDDCTRTSDMYETDGSDDGADLEGFVVDDDMATSSAVPTSSAAPRSSLLTPRNKRSKTRTDHSTDADGGGGVAKEKPYFVPMQFPLTEDSGDDLTDLETMVAKPRDGKDGARQRNAVGKGAVTAPETPEKAAAQEDDDDDDDVFQRTPVNRNKRRRLPVLPDSDDDDE
ncbi:hypothetical protein V8F20_000325 [Naviculisporaceae sp. PSN 640]